MSDPLAHPRPAIPANIEPFFRVLGEDGTIAFLLAFGGAELYLAENPTERSRLVQVLGRDRATVLARACAGMPARIPTAKRWIAGRWRARGLPVAEIARRLHVSDVTVRSWENNPARDGRSDPRQPDLF